MTNSLSLKPKRKRLNKTGDSTMTKGDVTFYIALLALPILQLCVFYFAVNAQSFLLAFQAYDVYKGFYWSPLTNFSRFFGGSGYSGTPLIAQSGFWLMVKNSFVVYLLTSLSGTVLATLFSYYIYKKRTLSSFFKIILFLPTILPGILLVVLFKNFAGEGVPAFLEALFGAKIANVFGSPSNARMIVITAFTIWVSFGSQVLVYTGAMDQIPNEVIEAGQLDGASSLREFFSIIIPYILPTVSTFLIGGLASIFTNQNNLFSFTQGGASMSESTIGYWLYMLIYNDTGDVSGYPFASFCGLIFTLIIMPLIVSVRKLVNKVTN